MLCYVPPWVQLLWDSLSFLDFLEVYFLCQIGEVLCHYLFKEVFNFLLFLFSFWHPYSSDIGTVQVVPEVAKPLFIFLKFLFLHSKYLVKHSREQLIHSSILTHGPQLQNTMERTIFFFTSSSIPIKNGHQALAGCLSWSIIQCTKRLWVRSPVRHIGCGSTPQSGCIWEATIYVSLLHRCLSLSLSLSPPASLLPFLSL